MKGYGYKSPQQLAHAKYDETRKKLPRYGGRCSTSEKKLLQELVKNTVFVTEKDVIFAAVKFARDNIEHFNLTKNAS